MRASEPVLVERADSYGPIPRGESARRADRHGAADVWIWFALFVGPLAVLVSRLVPAASAPSVAAALLSLVAGGIALGALPSGAIDADERSALGRRRRFALAVIVVALASIFVIARTAG